MLLNPCPQACWSLNLYHFVSEDVLQHGGRNTRYSRCEVNKTRTWFSLEIKIARIWTMTGNLKDLIIYFVNCKVVLSLKRQSKLSHQYIYRIKKYITLRSFSCLLTQQNDIFSSPSYPL